MYYSPSRYYTVRTNDSLACNNAVWIDYHIISYFWTVISNSTNGYILKENEEVKIVKGGITGMAVWIKWEPNQWNRFYSLSSFNVDGGGIGSNGSSIGFNTGRIIAMDRELGYFLINVLKENN